jgi:hypothetical protein
MEAIRSLETSVHTRATRRNIPEDDIPFGQSCAQCWGVGMALQTGLHAPGIRITGTYQKQTIALPVEAVAPCLVVLVNVPMHWGQQGR